MSLGELLSVSMMQLHVISDQVELGSHAHDGATNISVHQVVLLTPEVVEILDNMVSYV